MDIIKLLTSEGVTMIKSINPVLWQSDKKRLKPVDRSILRNIVLAYKKNFKKFMLIVAETSLTDTVVEQTYLNSESINKEYIDKHKS